MFHFRMTKYFQRVSHFHYNLDANEDFVISVTSKFITYFIDIHSHVFGLTMGIKSQPIAYLLKEGKHTC